MLYTNADSSVIVLTDSVCRIHGPVLTTIVTDREDGDIEITQEGDESTVVLARDEAEALFLVLDTMLHGSEDAATQEGVREAPAFLPAFSY